MQMTAEEFNIWIANSCFIETEESSYDESTNLWKSLIYKNAEKFYRVEKLNGHFIGKYKNAGIFEPQEVIRKERETIEVYYE